MDRIHFTVGSARVFALLAGASMAALIGGGRASAQTAQPAAADAQAGSNTKPQELVVTGSRIRGVPPVGSAMVAVSRSDITSSGAITITDLLQQIPEITNLGINQASRTCSACNSNINFTSSINIRGIGPFATLTLIDGHRSVPQGTSGFAVDPSDIPTIALERAEIIADGASAIYGSDAVAGVANLILRRNFEGLEVNARYGAADNYWEETFGVIGGHRWATGQLTLSYEYSRNSNLAGTSRPFENNETAYLNGANLVTACNPGTLTVNGVNYAIPAGGVTPATASSLAANTKNTCDNNLLQDILPMQTHNDFAATFDQDVTDRIHVFADVTAARRSYSRISPVATAANIVVPSTNPYYVSPPGVTVPACTAAQQTQYGVPAGTLCEGISYAFGKDFTNPASGGFSWNYTLTGGFDVKLPFDWRFTADAILGRDDDYGITDGSLYTNGLYTALGSSNKATAFNPFTTSGNPSSVVSPLLIGYTHFIGKTFLSDYEAKLDGPVFHLPGGDVKAAIGFESQDQKVWSQISPGGTLISPTQGTLRNVYRVIRSAYIEVNIPVVSGANAIPGIQKLTLDLAGRIDQYSDVGSTSNPKFGVNWTPIDGLNFHGSYGTSFRAPTLAQYYGNSVGLYVQTYSNPNGPPITGLTIAGPGVGLKPETATTYSFGGDWTPSFLPNLKIDATWFNVNYDGQVAAYLADLTVLNKAAQFAGTSIINSNPSPALIAQLEATNQIFGVPPATVTLLVDGRPYNLGSSVTQGIDFDGNYKIPTDHYGNFSVGFQGTYLMKYTSAVTPAAPSLNLLNTIQNPLQFRGRGILNWSLGGYSVVSYINYTNAYKNTLSTPVQTVPALTTVDLHLAYDFRDTLPTMFLKQLRIGLDVTNLFDAQPPFVNVSLNANQPGGYDPNVANPIGRIIAVTLDKRW